MTDPAARAGLYGFFSRLFVKELDEPVARALAGALGKELLPAFSASEEAAALATAEARERVFDPDFVHVTIVNLVPYESFYRRDDAMVESGLVNPLARFFREYGFEADLEAARSLSPDHLGIELEFMAVLATREAEAREAGDAAYAQRILRIERDFLRDHLLAWAPVYLTAVKRNARTLLYREAAEAALEFVLADYEEVSEAAKR